MQLLIRIFMESMDRIPEPCAQEYPIVRVIAYTYQRRQDIVPEPQPVHRIHGRILRQEGEMSPLPGKLVLLRAQIVDLRPDGRRLRLILILIIPRTADDTDDDPPAALSMNMELIVPSQSI